MHAHTRTHTHTHSCTQLHTMTVSWLAYVCLRYGKHICMHTLLPTIWVVVHLSSDHRGHRETRLRMLDGRDMCSCLETAHEKWSQKSDQRQKRCDCCHMHLLTDLPLHHCATHSCCSIGSIPTGSSLQWQWWGLDTHHTTQCPAVTTTHNVACVW